MIIECSGCGARLNAKDGEPKTKSFVRCPSCGKLTRFKGRKKTGNPGEESIIADVSIVGAESPRKDSTEQIQSGEVYKPDYPLPPRLRLYLDIKSGRRKGERFACDKGRIIIGRTGADLVLDEEGVSRKHASVEAWSRDQMYIRDLASTNGTFLNGSRVTQTRIKSGDSIQVGKVKLVFITQEEPS